MSDYQEMKKLFASMEDRFDRMETAIIAIREEIDQLQTKIYKEVTLPRIELSSPEKMESAIIAIRDEIDCLQTRFYNEVTLPEIALKPPELIPAAQKNHPNCQREDSL